MTSWYSVTLLTLKTIHQQGRRYQLMNICFFLSKTLFKILRCFICRGFETTSCKIFGREYTRIFWIFIDIKLTTSCLFNPFIAWLFPKNQFLKSMKISKFEVLLLSTECFIKNVPPKDNNLKYFHMSLDCPPLCFLHREL